MTTARRQRQSRPRLHRVHPVWRSLTWSAVTTAAIAALFSPLPAMAAPTAPAPAAPPAVPDSGLRPIPVGSLVMPGQATSTPITTTPVGTVGMTPQLAKIEKRRAQVALLGDRLLTLNDELAVARTQVATAERRHADLLKEVALAEQAATEAAAKAFRAAAALPPGTIGSDLEGLAALTGIQLGEGADERAAGRHLQLLRDAEQAAAAELKLSAAHATDLAAQYARLNTQYQREQAALLKLEQENVAAVAAQEAAEQAQDLQLGAGYLGGGSTSGSIAGKAADPRALAAVQYALAQRGDDYVWSTEGPSTFDCSGLMWAAYRTPAAGSKSLPRVSRYQYWATHLNAVDRYSLLPGDLLFFSSTADWTGIHHVAMYVGNGLMVEAPRTGLKVRLVPVRWTRLFAATRVYGPVNGPAQLPTGINDPDPDTQPLPSRPGRPSPTSSTTPPVIPTPSSRPPTIPKPPSGPKPPSSSASPSTSTSSGSPSASTSTSASATPSTSTSVTPKPSSSSPTPTPTPPKDQTVAPTPTQTSSSATVSSSVTSGAASSGTAPSSTSPSATGL